MFKSQGGKLTKTLGTFSSKGVFTPFMAPYQTGGQISAQTSKAILNRVVIMEAYWNIWNNLPDIPFKVEPKRYLIDGVPYRILVQPKKTQKITHKLPKTFVVGATIDPKVKSNSRLAVVVSSTNRNVARVKNGRIFIVGKGKATIVFTQKGNSAFKRQVVKVPINVTK